MGSLEDQIVVLEGSKTADYGTTGSRLDPPDLQEKRGDPHHEDTQDTIEDGEIR